MTRREVTRRKITRQSFVATTAQHASAPSVTTGKKPRQKRTKPSTQGARVGTHKRDMRWQDPTGQVWDSRYEYELYTHLKAKGLYVQPTGEQDSFLYTSPVRSAVCTVCGSDRVAKNRSYTPDLFVSTKDVGGVSRDPSGYYVEAKGYLRKDRRALLRYFRKAQPNVDLRLVVQADNRATKQLRVVEWAQKYLKIPVAVWRPGMELVWQ